MALSDVETHDAAVWHGYHIGYCRAMAHAVEVRDFTHRLPMRCLADVVNVLRGTGREFIARVYEIEPPNQYSVVFVKLRIQFVREIGWASSQQATIDAATGDSAFRRWLENLGGQRAAV